MRRTRNQGQRRRGKVRAAQAAMVSGYNELYAKYGHNFTLENVEEAWHRHGGPMGLTQGEFMEAMIGYFLETDPKPLVDIVNQAKGGAA